MPSIAIPVSLRGQLLNSVRAVTAFSPSTLFALNEPGVWYDPSDLTTLFQDTAGTTPVTTPGQTVALALDKSKGGQQSLPTTGWAQTSGDGVVTVVDNVITITGATTTTRVDVASPGWQIGDYARITVNASIGSAVGPLLFVGGAGALSVSAGAATYSTVISASTLLRLQVTSGSATFTVTARSRTPGFHATQATTASRPIYGINPVGGRRNLLLRTEEFDNAAWSKPAGTTTISANTATAPNGTMTADLVTAAAGSANHYVAQNNSTTGSVTATIYAKAGTASWLGLGSGYTNGVETAWFDLSNGTVGTVASGGTATITSAGNGWWRCSHTRSSWTGGAILPFVTNANGVAVFNAAGTENLLLWGAQLETGSTATAYQKVVSQYDVTEAGVASVSYLAFDGVDDMLVSSTVDFTDTNMVVFVGVRKLSDAATRHLVELGTGTQTGSFYLAAPNIVVPASYLWAPRGSSTVLASATGFAAPITNVVTGLASIAGDVSTIRVNGTQVATSTGDQGTGPFRAYPIYIGRQAGGSFPFSGNLYSLIVRNAATDASTITSTEAWVAGQTGIANWANLISPTIFARDETAVLDRFNQTIERRAV